MSTTSKTFFAAESNAAAIREFTMVLRNLPKPDLPQPAVVQPLITFLSVLAHNLGAFDEYCPVNIDVLGQSFISKLHSFVDDPSNERREALIDIFTSSYRFICELEFSQPGQLSLELEGVKNFVDENLEQFQGRHKRQLIYASYMMPAYLTKSILQHSSFTDFKAFADTANAAKAMKEEWDKEIVAKKAETDGLLDVINRMQSQYNFVGLVKGFEALANQKKDEARWTFWSLLALGVVMIVPVCTQLGFVLGNAETIDSHRATLIYSLPTLLALELILLYFFRVVLANYKGLQAQLLQLDLRVSLCQFIESYSEYSTKIKKADSSALERFEAIVFSGITSDAENMPTAFDGVEQLSKLVSSLRSK